MAAKTALAEVEEKRKKPAPKKNKRRKRSSHKRSHAAGLILPALVIIAGIVIVYLSTSSVSVGAKAVTSAFGQAKAAEEDKIYDKYYETSFSAAEAEYHVSNRGEIIIGSIKEQANLEVLQANATEYIITDETDNESEATSWLEVQGTGVFTVNMAAGEYLIDNERSSVLVRVPEPKFTNVKIASARPILFEDGTITFLGTHELNNGSTKAGEELAQRQREEAYAEIKEDIASNQRFYQSAKASAESVITNLIKELNRDIPGLTVSVEFI